MLSETRIREVLEELLDSNRTPEEVCADDPELLRAVRPRWERVRRVGHQLDALFPSDALTERDDVRRTAEFELPHIDGYEVEGILGRGGMGVVFRARHLKLNRLVALKSLLAGAYAGPHERARFRREAEAVAALRHPHIVQIYDVGELPGGPYFTMELVEGGSLAQKLGGRPLPPRQAAELIATLACGVQFAHQSGFMHRDLKPGNVLLTADGVPKITDFGLARPIDGGPEFTLTGARIGTPSYMAPEQALGKTSALGPAVDIYALGAVLYEMLTGRPPFEGESAADTERKVIADEPVPPSRRNARVPRDLETICLKCLHKDPTRRYASAQDLGDDLYRFLDGKPVIARPVGVAQRVVKWARRRPALATLGAAVALLLAASSGLGLWVHQRETARQAERARRAERARLAVETAIANGYRSARAERFSEAGYFLKEAADHLPEADSVEFGERVEQARRDVRFAEALSGVRGVLVGARAVDGFFVPGPSLDAWAEGYARAFAEARFDLDGDANAIAGRIRASRLPDQTIAALDHWALVALLLRREPTQKKLLRIARRADPGSAWRDRFRDPACWGDEGALRRLARDALATAKPPAAHQLAIIGALLRHHGAPTEEDALLHQAVLQRPGDFLLRWELAHALARNGRHREAAAHLRVVVGLRPGSSWIENHLGFMLCLAGGADEVGEGIEHLRRALTLEPTNMIIRYNLALALGRAGRLHEAYAECQRGIRAAPTDPWAYHALGRLYVRANRTAEAVPMFRKAIEYRPGDKGAHFNLGFALNALGRYEEALAEFRTVIGLQEANLDAHAAAAQALLKLRRYPEAATAFARVIRAFDEADDRGDEVRDHSTYVRVCLGRVEALLGQGCFAAARDAARRALDVLNLDEAQRQAVQQSLAIARQLAPLEGKLVAHGPAGPETADVATQRARAKWLYVYQHATVAAAQAYDDLLARNAPLDEEERARAALAAALAGSGLGSDASKLSVDDRAAWRARALTRLQAARPRQAPGANPIDAIRVARAWQQNNELAALFADAALAALPEAERGGWRQLWAEVNALAALDPLAMLESARAHADRRQWAKAAAIYAKIFETGLTRHDGDIWFERAAVQLLAGDRAGYRQSCERLLKLAGQGQVRAYHVARACTLAPDSVADAAAPARVSTAELSAFRSQFWALTEKGALQVRAGRGKQAVPNLMQSLKAELKPGAAVVNWLWLSLAQHTLGNPDEANRWLKKADAWLGLLGKEFPVSADLVGLHRHNWLEAQILRNEARSRLSRIGTAK
jgi:serine/threonine-protein kinase